MTATLRTLATATGALALAALGLTACGDDSGTGGEAGEPTTVTVEITGFEFEPAVARAAVGDSVVWANAHGQAHTATGDGDLRWTTGNVAPGDTSEPVELGEAGTFTYICALHPFMTGTVEVTG